MPLLGFLCGETVIQYIAPISRILSFILLTLIGLNMLRETIKETSTSNSASIAAKVMIPAAIATSIDAFAVGVTFAALKVNVAMAVLLIGCTAFLFSGVGVKIGSIFGDRMEKNGKEGRDYRWTYSYRNRGENPRYWIRERTIEKMVDKDTTIRILRYAKNGFLQNGYQGTSLANICGQAGVTTGALYHRFPSKDALFRAVVEPASNELLENLICPQENVNAIIPEPCLTFTYTYWDVFRTIVRCKDAPFYAEFRTMLSETLYQRLLQCRGELSRQAHLPFFLSKAYLAGFLEIIRCNYDFETAHRSIQIMDKFMLL